MKRPQNETYEHLLDVAEQLFTARGYLSVTLHEIAASLGMTRAALYYYVPDGKEQLFVDVMERMLNRHRIGMEAAIASAGPDLRDQLRAIASWLIRQPPLTIVRMEAADLPAIHPENAQKLQELAFDTLRLPLVSALQKAQAAKLITIANLDFAAITYTTLVEMIHMRAGDTPSGIAEKEVMIEHLITMLLDGWLIR